MSHISLTPPLPPLTFPPFFSNLFRGNWGPHLIIVPTSVMLNWELELKKWCPAFKILTYFGSFKERKQKRVVRRHSHNVYLSAPALPLIPVAGGMLGPTDIVYALHMTGLFLYT